VIEQVRNLAQTKIVQNAWHNKQALQLHAWVYGLNNGLITELKHILDNTADIDSIYRYEF
ncbi:MAG: carbonic anhydrase, partial [Bacteroidia bacterium]|jgi:carbonic anhydrase